MPTCSFAVFLRGLHFLIPTLAVLCLVAQSSFAGPRRGSTVRVSAALNAQYPPLSLVQSVGLLQPQANSPSQAASEDKGVWSVVKEAITDVFKTVIGAYVLPLLGLVVLLLIGLLSNNVLHFLYSNKLFQKLPWPPSFRFWIARRVGQGYLKRALKISKRKQDKALLCFRRGFDFLQRAQTEAEKTGTDVSRFRAAVTNPRLAPLYALSAWNYAVNRERLGDAIDAASRALELDPENIEARVARGWAKLQRNELADIGEAQSDFLRVIEIGEERQLRYIYALYGHGEALRLQGEPKKALEQYTLAIPDSGSNPEFQVGRGLAYHALGNWQNAVDDLTEALKPDPNNNLARVYRADALLQLRRFDEAIEDCEQLINRDPGNQQAHYVNGLALYEQSRSEAALTTGQKRNLLEAAANSLRTAKDIAAKNKRPAIIIYRQLALVLEQLGRNDEAQKWFLEARNTPASSGIAAEVSANASLQFFAETGSQLERGLARISVWARLKDPAELRLADEDFIASGQHARFAVAAYTGRAFVKYLQHLEGEKTLDESLALTRHALTLKQDSPLGWTHDVRGWIMIAKGQYDNAKSEFAAAIKHGWDESGTYYGAAEAERLLSNYTDALDTYTKAIDKVDSSSDNAWRAFRGRALVHGELRHWQPAFNDYQSAIDHANKLPIARRDLAELYADFAWACYQTERDAEMEAAFSSGLELEPRLGYLHSQMAAVRLYCGRYDEAINRYGIFIETDLESSLGYTNRGLTQIYRGDLDAALVDLDIAVAKNPNDAAAWHTRGWAHMRRMEWTKALADLSKAIEISDADPFRFNDRALVRWWLQDRKGALKDLHKVLEIKGVLAEQPLQRAREDAVTWGASAKDWSHAVERDPNGFIARLGRGIARRMAGDLAGALNDLKAAHKRGTRSDEVRIALNGLESEMSANAVTEGRVLVGADADRKHFVR